MRFDHALALSLACSLATTAGCTDLQSDELDVETEEAALVSSSQNRLDLDVLTKVGQISFAATYIGSRIMLTFGKILSGLEQIQCNKLDIQTETLTVDGCNYTVQNRNCKTGWSEEINQYVCVCERWVTGQSGNCGGR